MRKMDRLSPMARAAIVAGLLNLAGLLGAAELHVDFAQTNGLIRALHGGNCGPLNYGGLLDFTTHHRELGIPMTRLHDCHYPNPDVVDIHAIFPDFRADAALPENYQFDRTDDYLRGITNTGAKILYRLGESIEHTPKKYHVHPPRDLDKWVTVATNIIRHCNDGWANGLRLGIEYWEIWNEPDVRPQMWTGTDEDYYRLYIRTSRAIKQHWPQLKVGGPAAGYVGQIDREPPSFSPFIAGLLERCKKENAPLDFFSWHTYTANPWQLRQRAFNVRRLLDQHGFKGCESILDEWNYLPNNDWTPMGLAGQGPKRDWFYDQIGGPPGAAFTACALIYFQDCPLDMANYYTAEFQGFGLFNYHGTPKKTYYAMLAFKRLTETPLRVKSEGGEPDKLAIAAGLNKEKTEARILISNLRSPNRRFDLKLDNLPWQNGAFFEVLRVDDRLNLEKAQTGNLATPAAVLSLELPASSVALIRLRPAP